MIFIYYVLRSWFEMPILTDHEFLISVKNLLWQSETNNFTRSRDELNNVFTRV